MKPKRILNYLADFITDFNRNDIIYIKTKNGEWVEIDHLSEYKIENKKKYKDEIKKSEWEQSEH